MFVNSFLFFLVFRLQFPWGGRVLAAGPGLACPAQDPGTPREFLAENSKKTKKTTLKTFRSCFMLSVQLFGVFEAGKKRKI